MSTRAIASSTLWQLVSQVAMAVLSIITVKFVTIGLSKELVGYYNSAYGYLQLFGILADFGLYAIAVREVSRAEDKNKTLGALIVLRAVILIISLSSALLIAWVIPQWQGTPLPLSIAIASLVPFFTLLAGMLRTIFQVRYRMHYVFIAEVTQRVITASAIGAFVLWGLHETTDVQYLHLFLLIGGIGAFVLFALSALYGNRLLRPSFDIDRRTVLAFFRHAAPYGIAFLCMALYRQFDITLIAILRPDFELQNAYYGSVQRMADMAYLLPTFLLNSVLPILSERDAKNQSVQGLLEKTFLTILLIGAIAMLFAFFWARPLVLLLTTADYLSTPDRLGSDTALRLAALPMFLNGIILFSFYSLLTKHAWERLVKTLFIGAFVSLVCNLWLIPGLGFVGASLTSIVVHILLACLLLPQSLRVLPVHLHPSKLIRCFLFAFLLAFPLYTSAHLLTSELTTVIGLGLATLWMGFLAWALGFRELLWSEERQEWQQRQ
ncbi:MAG: oligosaccharide flippase family protein [Candidatus Peregrinibacteria bacterium]|nr:oligosaccharide flippase family protein [Candidatus Peregrinibacteria bacterium]